MHVGGTIEKSLLDHKFDTPVEFRSEMLTKLGPKNGGLAYDSFIRKYAGGDELWFFENRSEDSAYETKNGFVLLPINQQMEHLRARARKEEEIIHCEGNEYCNIPMDIVKTDPSKSPDLRTDEEKAKDKEKRDNALKGWTIVEEVGTSVVNNLAVLKDKVEHKVEKAKKKWLPLVHKKRGEKR
jgi:hypothetical protein